MKSAGWFSQIPRRYLGAGALITNSEGEVLIVEPTYKETWEIPGGVVEDGESPATACVRECTEEIGLTVAIGRLLVIDHQSLPDKGDSTMFVYDGGTFEAPTPLLLPAEELRSYKFAHIDEAVALLGQRVGKRVRHAIRARDEGAVVELEQTELRSA